MESRAGGSTEWPLIKWSLGNLVGDFEYQPLALPSHSEHLLHFSHTVAEGDVAKFRGHGVRIWPRYVASIFAPKLAIMLKRG
jgi:hypothetical protein